MPTSFVPIGIGAPVELETNGLDQVSLVRSNQSVAVVLARDGFESSGSTPEQWLYSLPDEQIESITFSRQIPCDVRPRYFSLRGDLGGELYLLSTCYHPTQGDEYTISLLHHNAQTGNTELVFPESLPVPDTNSIAVSPDHSTLILGFGTLFGGMYILDAQSPRAINSNVTIGGRTFSLSDAYTHYSPDGFTETGNAGQADWSPDGRSIVFAATTHAIGRTGTDRVTGPSALCFLDPTSWVSRCPLENLYDPWRPRWSPDGRFIALVAQYGPSGPQGLWLYDSASHALYFLAEGRFSDILWHPQAATIYTIKWADPEDRRSREVWAYELPAIVRQGYPEAP